ncbi:GAF and ANTAR domain-containing protein [Paenarthrobacter nitroguajacolicus]|uniref:GAF and ANTAR domain-containing protein n=1 Tax=Paenarthrobacter nitroguajacolicus TaxID=211146 RepID=UPI00351D1BE5
MELENTSAAAWSADFEQLSDLIVETEDIKAFLDGMACLAAKVVSRSAGTRVECGVTLGRHKRPGTIGGSTDKAMALERMEQTLGEGPCIDALVNGRPVLLDDAHASPQWPDYRGALSAAGMHSALGVPLALAEDGAAVLTFFSTAPGSFTRDVVAEALTFSELASKALRVALRITSLNELAEHLDAAIKSRSVIDTACGVIISQNRCTQDEAFAILRKASSDRNQKLHDLAAALVDGVGHQQTSPARGGASHAKRPVTRT